MISVGGVAVIGGTSGLPAGGTATDVLTGDEAWTSAGDVVGTALEAIPAADLAGLILPTALPGTALHLHRLNEASGALADQGSANVAAAITGSSAVRATPGPYRWGGGIELVSPAVTDRITVATSVPVGDCSIACTILSTTGAAPSAPAAKLVMALWDEGAVDAENLLGFFIYTDGTVYTYNRVSGTVSAGTFYTLDWTRSHRVVVTYEHGSAGATRRVKLFVDGVVRVTTTLSAALLATKTQSTLLGIAGDRYSTGACESLAVGDAQVWDSKLTPAQVWADYRQTRGALL